MQTANLERRLADLQCGASSSTGFSASGFSVSLSGRASDATAGLVGVSGPEGKVAPRAGTCAGEPLGVFVTGLGEFTNIGNTANAAGFDLRTGG